MKWNRKVFICIGIVLVLATGGVIAYPYLFTEPPEVVWTGGIVCYLYTSPEQLYEHDDLVITGVYTGDSDTYAQKATGYPKTRGTVAVNRVLKGSCGGYVDIIYTGGEISMLDSLRAQHSESEVKDMLCSSPEIKNQVVRMWKKEDTVNAVMGQEYIFFLLYNEEQDAYSVSANAYSMRPLNDKGQALNPDTQNYETLDILEEVQNTPAPE